MDGGEHLRRLDEDMDGVSVNNDDDFGEDPDKSRARTSHLYDIVVKTATIYIDYRIRKNHGTHRRCADEMVHLRLIMDDETPPTSVRTAAIRTYVDDGSGFVEVDLFLTPDEGGSVTR